MTDVEDKSNVSAETPSGLRKTRELIDQLGGETGMFGPLVRQISILLEDPVLSQVIDTMPNDSRKRN